MHPVNAALLPALLLAGSQLHAASPDLPPVGRSLFDHLTIREAGGRSVQHIPYPFEALLRALEKRAGVDALGRPGVAAVLIPIGRSLQRNASPGQHFEHPRVVAAVTGESNVFGSGTSPLMKDRLFLGFQDRAGVIEVISYNESAGRFEFQVVKDYRPGSEPRVFYAKRAVCTACHHNAAPIFSRPSWDETNANPTIARELAGHARQFHGVSVARGVDVPNAIDDAVARSNRFAMVQAVWRDACARVANGSDPLSCRAAALRAALKLRLSRAGEVDLSSARARADLLLPLSAAWQTQWPNGLPEPDPNIPNRDPFFGEAQHLAPPPSGERPGASYEIMPSVDPLALRPSVAVWTGDAQGVERFIRALASMLAVTDIDALNRWLQRLPAHASTTRARFELECQPLLFPRVANFELRCATMKGTTRTMSLVGSFRVHNARLTGTLARLQLDSGGLRDVALTAAIIDRHGPRYRAHMQAAPHAAPARLSDGSVLEALQLDWIEGRDTASYTMQVLLRNDLAALERALTALVEQTRAGHSDVLSAAPFRRAVTVRALFAQLGISGAPECCDQDRPGMPPAQVSSEETVTSPVMPAALRAFYQHCGTCHAALEASPPGFLHGELASVERKLARCAQRIQYRLDMWRLPPLNRSKVPMPPPSFALGWERTPPVDDIALMRSHLDGLLGSAQGAAAPSTGYESLPACRMDAPAVKISAHTHTESPHERP